MGEHIVQQLARCGLRPDESPLWQHTRQAAYAAALQTLLDADAAYACACTRREIEGALAAQGRAPARDHERVYPGTCRNGLHGRPARAQRFRVSAMTADTAKAGATADTPVVHWHDRRLGLQHQDVAAAVGDFVLQRADGLWAYQLAVVVDDAAQGVTHVVRGADLADNTARQVLLQRALGVPAPHYLHTPLVMAPDGHKLSKQNGAAALDLADPAAAVRAAAAVLGLDPPPAQAAGVAVGGSAGLAALLSHLVAAWGQRWPTAPVAGTLAGQ